MSTDIKDLRRGIILAPLDFEIADIAFSRYLSFNKLCDIENIYITYADYSSKKSAELFFKIVSEVDFVYVIDTKGLDICFMENMVIHAMINDKKIFYETEEERKEPEFRIYNIGDKKIPDACHIYIDAERNYKYRENKLKITLIDIILQFGELDKNKCYTSMCETALENAFKDLGIESGTMTEIDLFNMRSDLINKGRDIINENKGE